MFPCLEKQGGGRRSVSGRPKKKGVRAPFFYFVMYL